MYKNKDYTYLRSFISAWAIIFGAAFFNYTLIVCGKTFYVPGFYWLIHLDLQLMTNFYFLMALTILVSILFKFIKYKKILATIIPIVLIIVSYPFISSRDVNYVDNYNVIATQRRLLYESEKASAFYAYKGIDNIILPDSFVLYQTDRWVVEKGHWNNNFKYIHGFDAPKISKFVLENEFLDICKKDGLVFTEEELKETKFTNLLNKDFVLYGHNK